MNKTLKKTLSIILTILMIVTAVPFAFAADETPDFSDAKVLTAVDGILYIDGVPVNREIIPDGKYKLSGDISMGNPLFDTDMESDVIIDLNGYTWNSKRFILYVQGSFSVYDTSAQKTGKIISNNNTGSILTSNGASEINLYSGTLENIFIQASLDNCVINLYGGKIKCDSYPIFCYMDYSYTVNLYDTVLEASEGAAHIETYLSPSYTAQAVINVADYTGDVLTIGADINSAGKIKILEGIENAEEAEKYNLVFTPSYSYCYLEKTEYDEVTGELFAYVVANSFTQQPSAENDYTVDFNNPEATFQWYEAEKIALTPENTTAFDGVTFKNGKWLHTAYNLFTVSVQAGDIIIASTNSDSSFDLNVRTKDYSTSETITFTKTGSVAINADAEVTVSIHSHNGWGETTEFDFELIRTIETKETETGKKLQNPECGKSYYCKATVDEKTYFSDVVIGHDIIQVEAQAPTCTEIGWDAYEYCTACTYTAYEEIPSNGHTPLPAVKENEVAPKCGVAGSYDLVVYCDVCDEELDRDTVAVDALTHKDEDGDYLCDHGCGHEFEKPVDPTPDEPADDTCDRCGEVHTNFLQNFICMLKDFFNRIINFFTGLFK